MTRTSACTKHPPGLSDSTLEALYRRTVLVRFDYKCGHCGKGGGNIQVHHPVHRRCRVLKYDWRNGIPAHKGECHEQINLYGIQVPQLQPYWDYLRLMARKTLKAYLFEIGMSDAEFRGWTKTALLAELAAAGGA